MHICLTEIEFSCQFKEKETYFLILVLRFFPPNIILAHQMLPKLVFLGSTNILQYF